jgi:hypothetical protein
MNDKKWTKNLSAKSTTTGSLLPEVVAWVKNTMIFTEYFLMQDSQVHILKIFIDLFQMTHIL